MIGTGGGHPTAGRRRAVLMDESKTTEKTETKPGEPAEAPKQAAAPERKTGVLIREFYFPTPVYIKDLPDPKPFNDKLKQDIRAWQKEDPKGVVRSNVKQVDYEFYNLIGIIQRYTTVAYGD